VDSTSAPSARPDCGTCGFAIDRRRRYLLHNQTPKVIKVRDGHGGELVLSPLSERVVCGQRLESFAANLRPLRERHELGVRIYRKPPRTSDVSLAMGLLALVVAIVVVFDVLRDGTLLTWEALGALVLSAAVIFRVLRKARKAEAARLRAESLADRKEGDIEFGVGGTYYDGNETRRRLNYILTLAAVVTIGAVLPAVAIFVATDAKDFLVMNGGLRVDPGKESRLVSRLIQVTYTAVLALFPALLYFQFDRQRVGTIRNSWIRAIFRMDRRMETLSDVHARYGDQINEASTYSTDSVRFLGGRHSPIIVATILISLGWTLLVVRTESFDFAGATKVSTLARSADDAAQRAKEAASTPAPGAAEIASSAADQAALASAAAVHAANQSSDLGGATSPTTAGTGGDQSAPQQAATAANGSAATAAAVQSALDQPFFQLLVPTPSAATMAFLGAYFFAVYLVLRGYFRGDLRPKVYNQITARLVTVVVLAYLMNVLFFSDTRDNTVLWAVAFVAGVVPSTLLQRIGVLASSLAPAGGGAKKVEALSKSAGPENHAASEAAGRKNDAGSKSAGRKKRRRNAYSRVFATPRLLTHIDGVDLQEASRLESEGYPDITSLARSDLVAVMVNTRLPIEHLVDWTDQAVLILLVDDGTQDELDDRVLQLRHAGVRTASGLLDIAQLPKTDPARRNVARIVAADGSGMTIDSLARLIDREPAMARVKQWYISDVADVNQRLTIEEPPPHDESGGGHRPGTNGDRWLQQAMAGG
jgi:hypothetical protein